MIQKLTIPQTLDRADELLEAVYGSRDLGNKPDPLDELIFILLSLQTDSDSFHMAYRRLRDELPTWTNVLNAPKRQLAARG